MKNSKHFLALKRRKEYIENKHEMVSIRWRGRG
jgi:hypothetical protein